MCVICDLRITGNQVYDITIMRSYDHERCEWSNQVANAASERSDAH